MARRFTIQLLMDLATKIGANPAKLAGTRTNISFLGKGPSKNPLFQSRLAGLENATPQNLGKPETLFGAIEDAVGWAKDGKLNSIQTEILGHNLSGINKILNPPPLPMASVTDIRSGIKGINIDNMLKQNPNYKTLLRDKLKNPGKYPTREESLNMTREEALRKFPRESHKFFGRPLKDKDFSEIDRLIMEGKIPDARGRTWNFKTPKKNVEEVFFNHPRDPRLYKTPETGPERYNRLTGLGKQGPEVFNAALNQKTGMSRAISRELLQQDTRLNLKPEELFMLRTGKGEPLDLMRKYYGKSMVNFDEWLNATLNIEYADPKIAASDILRSGKLIPQFAEGGLARILEL